MQFATKELARSFAEIKCVTDISSSGKLTAPITEGGPFDIFVSAVMEYSTELFKSGLPITEPKIYAYGKLAIWRLMNEMEPSVTSLTEDEINHYHLQNHRNLGLPLSRSDFIFWDRKGRDIGKR